MFPAMKKAGYNAGFSASVTAVSSTIGGIIPPSMAIVPFAGVTNKSVGGLTGVKTGNRTSRYCHGRLAKT